MENEIGLGSYVKNGKTTEAGAEGRLKKRCMRGFFGGWTELFK